MATKPRSANRLHGPPSESRSQQAIRKLFNSTAWKRTSEMELINEPLCAACLKEDKVTAATCRDHIIPHRGDYELFWNGKRQSLCESCHSKKTASGR